MIGLKVKNGNNWINFVLDVIYPVGSLYMSINSTSPAILFGGSWAAIENRMIIGASTTYAAGNTGGSATTTISSANLPTHVHSVGAHSHGLNSHKHSVGAHTHGLNSHTHSVPKHGHGNNISYSVNSSGAVSGGITGGSHGHALRTRNDGASAGSAWGRPGEYGQTDWEWSPIQSSTHTHDLPNHTHTLTKSGGVSDCEAFTSGQASGSTANSTAFDSGAASGSTANSTAFDTGNGGFANTAMTTISPYYSAYIWRRTA